jgi:hypothetical protein
MMASGATTDVFGMGAYKLTAQFGGFTPPPPPTIGPDKFETNNTATTATNFGTVSSVSQTGLTLNTSSDVDYYTFTAAAKGTFTVSITPTQGSGTLGLSVLNAQQTVLASGQPQTGVTLSVSFASGQQYYVKVLSPTGSSLAYSLSVAKAGGGGGGGGGGGTSPRAGARRVHASRHGGRRRRHPCRGQRPGAGSFRSAGPRRVRGRRGGADSGVRRRP